MEGVNEHQVNTLLQI